MGLTMTAVTVKWDADTLRMANELEDRFSPLVEGRSQLTRLAIKIVYRVVTTTGTVQVITGHLQGLLGTSSSYPVIDFPAFPQTGERADLEALLSSVTGLPEVSWTQ